MGEPPKHRRAIETLIRRIYATPNGAVRTALMTLLVAEEGVAAAEADVRTVKK